MSIFTTGRHDPNQDTNHRHDPVTTAVPSAPPENQTPTATVGRRKGKTK
jgi:hypothetical protein